MIVRNVLRRLLRFLSIGVRSAPVRLYSIVYARCRGVRLGKGSLIHPGAIVRITRGGSIVIGDNCEFLRGSVVETYGGAIRIGNNVSLNYYSILYGHGGLDVGDGVRIAAHTVVIPANHGMKRSE